MILSDYKTLTDRIDLVEGVLRYNLKIDHTQISSSYAILWKHPEVLIIKLLSGTTIKYKSYDKK